MMAVMKALHLLKGLIFAIAIVSLTFLLSYCEHRQAFGSPLECESIKDADQRNYCRAVSKQQKSYCNFIKNGDLRHRCRAEVK